MERELSALYATLDGLRACIRNNDLGQAFEFAMQLEEDTVAMKMDLSAAMTAEMRERLRRAGAA